MDWIDLRDRLVGRGLQLRELDALVPNRRLYSTMTLQCRGTILADDDGIRQDRVAEVDAKLNAFFALAAQKMPKLLLTPEYSCPWRILDGLTANGPWPEDDGVWVMGMESIRPEELHQKAIGAENCEWEIAGQQETGDRTFLNPLCYLLNSTSGPGTSRKVVAVQFKGYAAGGHLGQLEAKKMIPGTERFIIKNQGDSIRLVSMVCSDCMEPPTGPLDCLPDKGALPYLVLHPQLNADPCHEAFRKYREEWVAHAREKMEILCLNWARGTTAGGVTLPRGQSTWHYVSAKGLPKPDDIDRRHTSGLFYCQSEKRRSHCIILGYDEHVLLVACPKILQDVDAAVNWAPRIGPEPLTYLTWESATRDWLESQPDDGFRAEYQTTGATQDAIACIPANTVDAERLLCLTSGEITAEKEGRPWHDVSRLPSFELCPVGRPRRTTFAHESDPVCAQSRNQRMVAIIVIANRVLRSRDLEYPAGLGRLRLSGKLRFPVSDCDNANVCDQDAKYACVFVYGGDRSADVARRELSRISDALGNQGRKVVYWYNDVRTGTLSHIVLPVDVSQCADPSTLTTGIDKEDTQ